MAKLDRPKTLWPVGSKVQFLDAWMRNPSTGTVVNVTTGDHHLCADDTRGIRHYLHTDRITSAPPGPDLPFDDLLGNSEPNDDFADLLG
jgi:hypothetical protein